MQTRAKISCSSAPLCVRSIARISSAALSFLCPLDAGDGSLQANQIGAKNRAAAAATNQPANPANHSRCFCCCCCHHEECSPSAKPFLMNEPHRYRCRRPIVRADHQRTRPGDAKQRALTRVANSGAEMRTTLPCVGRGHAREDGETEKRKRPSSCRLTDFPKLAASLSNNNNNSVRSRSSLIFFPLQFALHIFIAPYSSVSGFKSFSLSCSFSLSSSASASAS